MLSAGTNKSAKTVKNVNEINNFLYRNFYTIN